MKETLSFLQKPSGALAALNLPLPWTAGASGKFGSRRTAPPGRRIRCGWLVI